MSIFLSLCDWVQMKGGGGGVEKVKEMACPLSSAFEGSTFKYFINENSGNGVYYGHTMIEL